MVTKPDPTGVRVRMYQVGFGDCFLVSLEYPKSGQGRSARHILFDLGSTSPARDSDFTMETVAQLVKKHTADQLDVLVITHRHKDHIGGFGIDASGAIIKELKPKLVLRPWTEDPGIDSGATSPANKSSRRFAASLSDAQTAVGKLKIEQGRRGALGVLAARTEEQLPNAEAMALLEDLSDGGRGRYLHAGKSIRLGSVVPGLKLTVLGPPTVEQHPEVAHQASRDDEYWMLRLTRSLQGAAPGASSPRSGRRIATASIPPGPVRWLVEHLKPQRTSSVARLVRSLDDALNNTSLILLLEVGELSLLFPGDAQIENWNYTLGQLPNSAELVSKLTNIDLYKVGHHGSRNATPRSLHQLWQQRPAKAPRMTALMSTRAGVHGKKEETAVPRATLVKALEQVADLHSTDDLPRTQPYLEVFAKTTGGPFKVVKPKPED